MFDEGRFFVTSDGAEGLLYGVIYGLAVMTKI